jgi:hypothetical protein
VNIPDFHISQNTAGFMRSDQEALQWVTLHQSSPGPISQHCNRNVGWGHQRPASCAVLILKGTFGGGHRCGVPNTEVHSNTSTRTRLVTEAGELLGRIAFPTYSWKCLCGWFCVHMGFRWRLGILFSAPDTALEKFLKRITYKRGNGSAS